MRRKVNGIRNNYKDRKWSSQITVLLGEAQRAELTLRRTEEVMQKANGVKLSGG